MTNVLFDFIILVVMPAKRSNFDVDVAESSNTKFLFCQGSRLGAHLNGKAVGLVPIHNDMYFRSSCRGRPQDRRTKETLIIGIWTV